MSALENAVAPSVSMTWFAGFRLQTSLSHNPRYLHLVDLTKTTSDIRMAWVGTATQVKAVRKLYPHTKAMKVARHAARDTLRHRGGLGE